MNRKNHQGQPPTGKVYMCGGSIRPNRYQMALPLHDSNPVIGGDAPIQACISVGQAF